MDYRNILYTRKGRIATVTLNRPEKLNALSNELLAEYQAALKEAEQDRDIRVVILKGAGRAFCAGYDIGSTAGGQAESPSITPFMDDNRRLHFYKDTLSTAWRLSKPVIAQVHGYCVAGGNDISGQCDIVIAADNARIGMPQIRRLGLTSFHMWPYKCGMQWSKILMFTGDTISGKEAAELGIVAMAVPEEKLEERVTKLAERIAIVDPTELATNKAMINAHYEAAGLDFAVEVGIRLDTIAHTNQAQQEFRKTSLSKGLKAALEASDGPFNASPRPW
jgi:enoyl-CoA hydratase